MHRSNGKSTLAPALEERAQTAEGTALPAISAKRRWIAPVITIVNMAEARAGNATAGNDLFTAAS